MLVGPVAARCRELIEGKCAEKGWEILALAVQPDHFHLFVRVWRCDSAANVVKKGKGITSVHLHNEFAHLLTLPSTRTRSYFAGMAGTVSQETIQRQCYIDAPTGR